MIKIIIYDDRYEVRTLEIGELLGVYSKSDYRLVNSKDLSTLAIISKSSKVGDTDTNEIARIARIWVRTSSCIIIREDDRNN